MSTTKLAVIAFAVVVALSLSANVFAAENAPAAPMKAGAGNAVPAVIEGVNTCLGCSLMNEGATAECSKSGHMMALKVTKAATPDGKPLPEFNGWTVHYMNNVKGMELTNDAKCHGKTLVITGTVFRDERVLDVTKVDMKDMGKMEKPMDGKMKESMSKKKN
ncbi:MAG: hypothetical protein HZB26_14100 [Candidatus Hydrogenedentes bacterium]|nr:hypothetical protein [Candidatus Hydrogenedentota bacterium]